MNNSTESGAMNNCDLEETRRLVNLRIDEAIEDASGWIIRRVVCTLSNYPVGRELWHEGSKVSARPFVPFFEKQTADSPLEGETHETAFELSLNGVFVEHAMPTSDRGAQLMGLLEWFNDQAECERLLRALNPPKSEPAKAPEAVPTPTAPWWKFWQ